jgi:glutamate-5-semialdehyde dehydrogenase
MSTSTVVEIDECDEPSSVITLSLCRTLAQEAKLASRHLAMARGAAKNAWLKGSASALLERRDEVLSANGRDVAAAPAQGLNPAAVDRLLLTPKRIEEMAQTLRDVAALPDPIGETVASSRRPNGLEVRQVRVPLGVIFMIY